jgi:hypothetical protein
VRRPHPDRGSIVRAARQLAPPTVAGLVGWWSASGPGRSAPAVIGVGLACLLLLLVAAVRSRGRVRLSWAAVAVAEALWSCSLLGADLGWPNWLVWAVLRPVAFLIVTYGLIKAPGVRRGWWDWGLVLMDGWLIGASSLEIAWVVLTRGGITWVAVLARRPPSLVWAGFDLLACTAIAGLAVRSREHSRGTVALVGVSAMFAIVADSSWAATGQARLGIAFWLPMLACLGASTLGPRLDIWSGAAPDPDGIQLARLSHVAVVPGLLAAILAEPADTVSLTVGFTLLIVLGAEMLLATVETRALWARTRAQSHRLDTVLRGSRDAIVQLPPADGSSSPTRHAARCSATVRTRCSADRCSSWSTPTTCPSCGAGSRSSRTAPR